MPSKGGKSSSNNGGMSFMQRQLAMAAQIDAQIAASQRKPVPAPPKPREPLRPAPMSFDNNRSNASSSNGTKVDHMPSPAVKLYDLPIAQGLGNVTTTQNANVIALKLAEHQCRDFNSFLHLLQSDRNDMLWFTKAILQLDKSQVEVCVQLADQCGAKKVDQSVLQEFDSFNDNSKLLSFDTATGQPNSLAERLKQVDQGYLRCPNGLEDKYHALAGLFTFLTPLNPTDTPLRVIIFASSPVEATEIVKQINTASKSGLRVLHYYDLKDLNSKSSHLWRFEKGEYDVLVATSTLPISLNAQIELVIQFDVPGAGSVPDMDTYYSRMTSSFPAGGVGINLIGDKDSWDRKEAINNATDINMFEIVPGDGYAGFYTMVMEACNYIKAANN